MDYQEKQTQSHFGPFKSQETLHVGDRFLCCGNLLQQYVWFLEICVFLVEIESKLLRDERLLLPPVRGFVCRLLRDRVCRWLPGVVVISRSIAELLLLRRLGRSLLRITIWSLPITESLLSIIIVLSLVGIAIGSLPIAEWRLLRRLGRSLLRITIWSLPITERRLLRRLGLPLVGITIGSLSIAERRLLCLSGRFTPRLQFRGKNGELRHTMNAEKLWHNDANFFKPDCNVVRSARLTLPRWGDRVILLVGPRAYKVLRDRRVQTQIHTDDVGDGLCWLVVAGGGIVHD